MSITVEEAKIKYNLIGKKYDDARTWVSLSYLPLPEELIREAKDNVDWWRVSKYSKLSEEFIGEFRNYVKWTYVSECQKLSEEFIRKFKDYINWYWISKHQKLSESFIDEFKDIVNWSCISTYQKLSEQFIREMQDYVDWHYISRYQPLSEDFIREFSDKVNWHRISQYQIVSERFLQEFGYKLKNNSDKPESYWKERVQNTGLYECYDDFFYAYKGIRSDRYSRYNFQYQYLPGETYECFSDYSDEDCSFGLSAWTRAGAEIYCNELVVKVKVYYKDVTALVCDMFDYDEERIRCKKLTIME